MEKLKELLAKLTNKEITPGEFETELANLLATGEITQEQHDEAIKGGGADDDKPLTRKEIEDLLEKERQSAADRVRTEYSKKLKDAEKARELLELEKMTEKDKAEYKQKQLEADLKAREDALNKREVEIHVVDQLNDLKIPLNFKPFFIASPTKDEATDNIKTFADVWQKELSTAVEERFKGLGDKGRTGGGGVPTQKKWSQMTLAEQTELFKTDPQAAINLAKQSGINLQNY